VKRICFVLLVLAFVAITLPVAAARNDVVGDRLSVFFDDEIDFAAEAPFYVRHGFMWELPQNGFGGYEFELEVDGEYVHWDYHLVEVTHDVPCSADPNSLCDTKLWSSVTNFPEGKTGTHIFNGHWLAPCRDAEVLGFEPCFPPGAQFETRTTTVTVHFVEP